MCCACNTSPEACASDLGDDQSRYLYVTAKREFLVKSLTQKNEVIIFPACIFITGWELQEIITQMYRLQRPQASDSDPRYSR